MSINAINALEASKQILQVIYATDYRHSSYMASRYGYTYVYFSPEHCKYYFEPQQRKDATGLIKRYGVIDSNEVIEITAHKYSFTQIAIGSVISRKFMTYKEFFGIAKAHYDWVR